MIWYLRPARPFTDKTFHTIGTVYMPTRGHFYAIFTHFIIETHQKFNNLDKIDETHFTVIATRIKVVIF